MRFKPRFSEVLHIFLVGGTLRLSFGRSRKVYVLTAVNTVPSRSSRYIYCFLATAQNHSLNRIGLSVKEDYGHQPDTNPNCKTMMDAGPLFHMVYLIALQLTPVPYYYTAWWQRQVCVCVCVCAFLCV